NDGDTVTLLVGQQTTWWVTDVYAGVLEAGEARVSYEGIYNGGAADSAGLVLRYDGRILTPASGQTPAVWDIAAYQNGVSVDLGRNNLSGFKFWNGNVHTIHGTAYSDVILGNEKTRAVYGGDGDDQIGLNLGFDLSRQEGEIPFNGLRLDGGAGRNSIYIL